MQVHINASRLNVRIGQIPNIHAVTGAVVSRKNALNKRKFSLFAAVVTDQTVPEGMLTQTDVSSESMRVLVRMLLKSCRFHRAIRL